MDWKILRSLLEIGCKPEVINFENLHLNREERLESRAELNRHGYEYIEYGWDTCAISREALK